VKKSEISGFRRNFAAKINQITGGEDERAGQKYRGQPASN